MDLAADGEDGHFLGDTEPYDAVVLDIGLPVLDGISVLENWRRDGRLMPVLLLTARDRWSDKVAGIDAGADDYVTKPYDVRELAARVRAILRRPKAVQDSKLTIGQLEIDTKYIKAKLRGEEIDLAPIEFSLLEFFVKHPDEHFSSQILMDRVWSSESESSTDVVRVHITRLRKKLSSDSDVQVIKNMRGLGYYLDSKSLE